MLRNIFYIGKILVPQYEDEPEEIVEGLHEPLVSDDVFYRVQDILDGKMKHKPKLRKAINPDLYLRNILICPICGHALTGSESRGNGGLYAYYNCAHDGKHLRAKAQKVNDGFVSYLSSLKPNETVLNLYYEILNDLKSDSRRECKTNITKLQEEKMKVAQRINKTDDKFLDGDIDKEMYNRLINRYKQELSELDCKIEMLQTLNSTKIEPKLGYSISLISNMDRYMKEASVEVKIKLIGSMFSEKIEFDGKNYRTKNYNKVLDLIYQQTNELRGNNKKKLEENDFSSNSVPRPGIEPGWVAPLVFETSASTDSAIWA